MGACYLKLTVEQRFLKLMELQKFAAELQRAGRNLHHRFRGRAVIDQHQSVFQHLGADGGDGIAVVITLEILAVDEDLGVLGDGQRQIACGAVGCS